MYVNNDVLGVLNFHYLSRACGDVCDYVHLVEEVNFAHREFMLDWSPDVWVEFPLYVYCQFSALASSGSADVLGGSNFVRTPPLSLEVCGEAYMPLVVSLSPVSYMASSLHWQVQTLQPDVLGGLYLLRTCPYLSRSLWWRSGLRASCCLSDTEHLGREINFAYTECYRAGH